jgi:peptidoglycan-associated lipoprotein
MKEFKIIFFSAALVFFSSATLFSQSEAKKGPHMSFQKEHVSLGKVKHGDSRTFEYHFTNTGDEFLQIDQVSSCNCTKIDYPVHKILPGKSGTLKVTFDSTEKEKSETVDIDIYLTKLDPRTNMQVLKILTYDFELIK